MIPCYGRLELLDPPQFVSFASQALGHVSILWNAMQHNSARPPLGHDGYLKLWALAKPTADADYLMVDESQDLNPVLLGVVRNLHAPIVFMGDPYQQIYQWRGAVNAMNAIPSRHQAFLTKSFRFGREIAAAATIILKTLGATRPLVGSPAIESHIARVKPDAILARSNVGVITNVLGCLRRNIRCAVLGGTQELERLLGDVQRIKQKLPAQRPELLGSDTWKDVMSASVQPEGDHLRALVNLVQEHGESQMLSALSRCQPTEETAQVVCSTAHRAKGREWNHVRLDRDFEAGFAGAAKLEDRAAYEAEARLLYVAVTRAKRALHLPSEIGKRFGIRKTSDEVLELGVPSPSPLPVEALVGSG